MRKNFQHSVRRTDLPLVYNIKFLLIYLDLKNNCLISLIIFRTRKLNIPGSWSKGESKPLGAVKPKSG